ncbi:hypothetical protein AARAC_011839 [Aspergillus arachidicola]|uniref:Benzoate 4-monooxygenase cytochrome P450 n=1 Tax=Aspergillus arachidicola TaxID=656916 RepID=A0A2G7FMJ7_9EURO|nr:hypothetical protein AARAC_011839 [Aspergillus arachidicola]
MQLIWLAVGAASIVIFLHLFTTWWHLRHIPGPFLASITNLQRVWWVKTGRAHLYHQAIHAKYGEVVRIGPHLVSFSNPEAISTVYPIRPGFPKSDFYATLRPYTRERGSMLAVFNTQNEQIHKQIKSPIAPLFSLSNIVMFEGLVEEVLSCLSEQFDTRFAGTGETFDFGEWLQYFAFDVMGTMSFSRRYGFLEQGRDVNGMLDAVFQFMKTAAPMSQIPWADPWIYKNRFVNSLCRTPAMSILGFVDRVIRERLDNPDHSHKDFLARFLEIQEANSSVPPWASTAWTFSNVIAGSDSVGTVMRTIMCPNYRNHTSQCRIPTLLNSIDNLLTHPATLQALSSELITANLTLPYPKWNEVCDLPYLDACIQEAVRLHPPFALLLERVVPAGGVSVLNHYLPEGTLVGGNPYVVNRHAETFGPDVEEWRPGRWLEGEGRKKLEQSVLTFGAGRRVCLGKYIGILELKKLVPFLVLKYDMKIIDPERFSVENGFFFKQREFYCSITRRKEGSHRDKADSK